MGNFGAENASQKSLQILNKNNTAQSKYTKSYN